MRSPSASLVCPVLWDSLDLTKATSNLLRQHGKQIELLVAFHMGGPQVVAIRTHARLCFRNLPVTCANFARETGSPPVFCSLAGLPITMFERKKSPTMTSNQRVSCHAVALVSWSVRVS